MKQLRIFFIMAVISVVNAFSHASFAQDDAQDTVFDGPGLEGGDKILRGLLPGTGISTQGSLIRAILFWIKILLIFAGILAFVAFVWAGFLYITTFVSEENSEKAKKVMIYAAIGILVILFSYILTNFFITATV